MRESWAVSDEEDPGERGNTVKVVIEKGHETSRNHPDPEMQISVLHKERISNVTIKLSQ